MSKSIDSLVLLESNVKKLKSLVIELKKENSIISKNAIVSKDDNIL